MNPRTAIALLAVAGMDYSFGRGFPASTPPEDKGKFKTGSRSGGPTYTPSPYESQEALRERRKRQRQAKKRNRR